MKNIPKTFLILALVTLLPAANLQAYSVLDSSTSRIQLNLKGFGTPLKTFVDKINFGQSQDIKLINTKGNPFIISQKSTTVKQVASTTEEKLNFEAVEEYKKINEAQIKQSLEYSGRQISEQTIADKLNQEQYPYYTNAETGAIYNQFPGIANYNQNFSTNSNVPEGGINTNSPVTMNNSSFRSPLGNTDGLDPRLFKILPDGWLQTNASNFGLNTNGTRDSTILSKFAGKTAMSSVSASGPVVVTNKHTCILSFPREVQDYYFGKVDWKSARSVIANYKKVAGTPVEVVNLENGKCAVAPLWETGPGNKECQKNKCGLDLTYCVKVVMLKSTSGATPVKYRPVPTGKKGCEGYSGIVAPVIIQKK